ncbi:MAG TPA: hypothetical protein VFS31_14705, partial [Chitinophagaceae bacterium]|nr:hypothetical protein [Chitinophagaceae bacterium]
ASFMHVQYPGEQLYYGKTVFENSPLNRVEKTFAPGNSWAGSEGSTSEKAVTFKYLINTIDDAVRIWTINFDPVSYDGSNNMVNANIPTSPVSPVNKIYNAGELYKNVTLDESGSAVVEYKDKEGQVILKKVQVGSIAADYSGHGGFLCTYYVYDDLNRLRFVIPPKAVQAINSTWSLPADVVNELCFRYEYDERGRMIAKKVPGAGWAYMVYDKRDRLVFTQDANMRVKNQWLTTLYDALNRPVATGMITYSSNRDALQSHVNSVTGNGTVGTATAASPIAFDLISANREWGKTLYQARNTIEFLPGFESETAASFTAEIVNPPATSESMTVVDNTLTTQMNFVALTLTYYDNYNWRGSGKAYSTTDNAKLTTGGNLHAETLP